MSESEFIIRLAVGLGCGTLIGMERQWRQRMAGLRTNALVATGACLFVLLALSVRTTGSATQIIAQIVSGIGFLGAGVIITNGVTVQGINTAATIWCSAAVGSLAGAGFLGFSATGAAAIVLVNLALRPVARGIDRQPSAAAEFESTYEFRAVTRAKHEASVRAQIVQALTHEGFHLHALHSEDLGDGDRVEVRAVLGTTGQDQSLLEEAVSRLSLQPSVTAVTWEVLDPPADERALDIASEPAGGFWFGLRRGRRTVVTMERYLRSQGRAESDDSPERHGSEE